MTNIPSGYAQVNLRFAGDGWPTGGECTYGVRLLTADGPDVVAATIRDITLTRLQDRIPTHVTLNTILVKFGPNTTGVFAELGVGEAGTGSSGDVNPNQAMLIKKSSSLGGRKGRGRMYWPIAEDQMNNAGVLKTSPDQVAAMNAALADWAADHVAADLPLMLLHNDPGDTPSAITSLATQAISATQRRRLRR